MRIYYTERWRHHHHCNLSHLNHILFFWQDGPFLYGCWQWAILHQVEERSKIFVEKSLTFSISVFKLFSPFYIPSLTWPTSSRASLFFIIILNKENIIFLSPKLSIPASTWATSSLDSRYFISSLSSPFLLPLPRQLKLFSRYIHQLLTLQILCYWWHLDKFPRVT